MYKRIFDIEDKLDEAMFLFGARQTGKSTLLKERFKGKIYYDLLDPDVRKSFKRNPNSLKEALWDKPAGTFTYEWNDEILMNNTVFENGTATITVDKGTGISVLSLTGNIEQNSSGTLYEVSLKLTMQPK